jgi:fatty aldehyde-generating acyl-ACP reductase
MIPFSFFVHFRRTIRDDMRFLWQPLGLLPESFFEKCCNRLNHRSYVWTAVQRKQPLQKNIHLGNIEIIPMSASTMLALKREDFVFKMNQYLDKLVKNGIKIAGLGALTAPLTAGGLALAHRNDICLTNGNAFTAVIMAQGVEKMIQDSGLQHPKVAIVGATGSVGSCVTQILARNGNVQDFLLISQTLSKLETLAATIESSNRTIQVSTDLMTLTNAAIVVVLTASNATLILPKHLKTNALVLDGTQPRNTSARILTERPDVSVIDGGLVAIHDIGLTRGTTGLPKGEYFACFSETLLLSLEARQTHFCLGNATLEHADWITQVVLKHASWGFRLAPFSSFGKPITLKKQQDVSRIRELVASA